MTEQKSTAASAANKHFRYEEPDSGFCRSIARELNVPYPIAVLLWQRGIREAQEARKFFSPMLAELPSPFLMKDMDRAIDLTVRALKENWPLYIHGDYDVDGVTGSALLARLFGKLDRNTVCYQPDRLTEGYGLQEGFIRKNAPGKGERALLITVDCGISDFEEIKLARELGFTVIVTDHHLPGDDLPPADAVLNPHREDCSFPFSDLAGVGVAFFFACGIRNSLVEKGYLAKEKAPNLKELMDLVALGTVADVMPLTGTNRLLVRAGLEVMNQQDCLWVQALLKQQNSFSAGDFTTEDISYRFAPRINAPGRLGKPELSFYLLSCMDKQKCNELAARIEKLNQERRDLESQAFDQLAAECDRQEEAGAPAFVVYGPFHQGVIGIIASRIVDRYGKPAVIFTDDASRDGVIKGSGRSVNSVNLYAMLRNCSESIIQYGGHAMAAGLAIDRNNLDVFREKFQAAVAQLDPQTGTDAVISVDYCCDPEEILNREFYHYYRNMQPFGNGNPEPIFLFDNPQFVQTGIVKDHLTYAVKANGQVYRGIGFNMADRISFIQNGPVRLVFKLRDTVYRGEWRMELHAMEIVSTA